MRVRLFFVLRRPSHSYFWAILQSGAAPGVGISPLQSPHDLRYCAAVEPKDPVPSPGRALSPAPWECGSGERETGVGRERPNGGNER